MKKLALVLLVIIAIGVVWTGYAIYDRNNNKISERPIPEKTTQNTIVSASAAEPEIKKTEVHSADGEANALLEEKAGTYSLYSCDVANCENRVLLYKTELPSNEKLELPFNAWSPDNDLVFVVKKGGAATDYMVFRASGETFANGEQFMDVTPIFAQKQPNLTLKDVSGWDSDTLLHVYTEKEGENGPNFWFEIPSGALIQLAH